MNRLTPSRRSQTQMVMVSHFALKSPASQTGSSIVPSRSQILPSSARNQIANQIDGFFEGRRRRRGREGVEGESSRRGGLLSSLRPKGSPTLPRRDPIRFERAKISGFPPVAQPGSSGRRKQGRGSENQKDQRYPEARSGSKAEQFQYFGNPNPASAVRRAMDSRG